MNRNRLLDLWVGLFVALGLAALLFLALKAANASSFSADNLPSGLSLDASSGLIYGSVATTGSFWTIASRGAIPKGSRSGKASSSARRTARRHSGSIRKAVPA
mgnify:CR=1 FL=1